MSDTAAIAEVKARFADYVRRAERGETIVLTRHGRPVARLAPIASRRRSPGAIDEIREPGGTHAPERGVPGRPSPEGRRDELTRVLEREIWPRVPKNQLGRSPDKKEREDILGYVGSDGV